MRKEIFDLSKVELLHVLRPALPKDGSYVPRPCPRVGEVDLIRTSEIPEKVEGKALRRFPSVLRYHPAFLRSGPRKR